MKKSRIQNICIHHVKVSQEEQKEISEKLTYYRTKAMKQKLDSTNLSPKSKLNILYIK